MLKEPKKDQNMPGNHPETTQNSQKSPNIDISGHLPPIKQTKTNSDVTESHLVRVPLNFLIKLLTSYKTHLSQSAFN